MNRLPNRAEALFTDALVLPAAERGAFLAKECGADVDLLAHLVALVAAHEGPDTALEPPVVSPAGSPEENAGDVIGRYKLLEKLGEGGCGAVWAAEQREPVKRRVALKIIKLGMDTRQVIARFEAERQAHALMEHPNIAKMLDAGATATGRPYFVMELVRGVPITRYCDENNLPTPQRLALCIRVCHAIQHAHQKGIIHRDIKPSNVLVTLHDGEPVPKVIDFGIAKATQHELTEKTVYTKFQQFIGTPAYMSPEQAEMSGLDIDTRADIYSLGVLTYELVTGRTPFDSKELLRQGVDQIRRTIREQDPPRPSTRFETMQGDELTTAARRRSIEPRKLVASVRGDLDWVVMKCLEKDRTRRYDAAASLAADIQRYLAHEPVVARPPSTWYRARKFVRRYRVVVTAGTAVLAAVIVGSVLTTLQALRALRAERAQNELRASAERAQAAEATARRAAENQEQKIAKTTWAREVALPEIQRLLKKDDIAAAFDRARQAEAFIPQDPALVSLWPQLAVNATVETTPSGADVYVKAYNNPAGEWEYLGKTPLANVRLARCAHRWRFEKDSYVSIEKGDGWVIFDQKPKLMPMAARLDRLGDVPPGMVRVGAESVMSVPKIGPPRVAPEYDFWIDKYEVTNRAFKEFVDRGGYTSEKFWKQPFVQDQKVLDWATAVAQFRDETGRPGPATWANGTYPEGQADYPVTGVSWYEAAAYAEFAGKRLPPVAAWQLAALREEWEVLVPFSNFGRGELAPVGQYQGISSCGAYDMAGNAKEWAWNEGPPETRCLLGGGAGEQEYMFTAVETIPAFARSPLYGFRCIKPIGLDVLPETDLAPKISPPARDFAKETPASNELFESYRRQFAYDRTPLDVRVEKVDDNDVRWRKERVSYAAAYNGESMGATIWLPRQVRPPYQVVVYFPGTGARRVNSMENIRDGAYAESLADGGRMVVWPVIKDTFERRLLQPFPKAGSVQARDLCVQWVKDVSRTLDYLETREDVRRDQIAYYGFSMGADFGPVVTAIERRFKASILAAGGLKGIYLPEVDPFNFEPRVALPTLMMNGRYDSLNLLKEAQLPLYQLLGVAEADKRHILYDSGHMIPPHQSTADALDWLDHYLGKVR